MENTLYIDTEDFHDYKMEAKNGLLGRIHDFYFDEDLFYLRYFVVNTKPFLMRHHVIVSPISLQKINEHNRTLELYLTKEELENAPEVDSAMPVSRAYEKLYNEHFSWPHYWGHQHSAWAVGPYGIPWGYYQNMNIQPKSVKNKKELLEKAQNNKLRSAKELRSYSIKGSDDEFGHIQGYILNKKTLSIDFVIVDTIKFMPSKLVLLRPEWIKEISWHSKTVTFPFSKELIKSAPAYKKSNLGKELITKTDEHFKLTVESIPQEEIQRFDEDERPVYKINKLRGRLVKPSKKEVVVGQIPSGLFVVTTHDEKTEKSEGFLASWVQQASFDPLLVSVCIKSGRPGIDHILKKSPFCINVVSEKNSEYINYFRGRRKKGKNPLTKVSKQVVPGKGVLLQNANSVIVCKPKDVYCPGDHFLITAEVTDGVLLNETAEPKTYIRNDASHY